MLEISKGKKEVVVDKEGCSVVRSIDSNQNFLAPRPYSRHTVWGMVVIVFQSFCFRYDPSFAIPQE